MREFLCHACHAVPIADAYDLAGCKLIPNAAEITPVVFVISD